MSIQTAYRASASGGRYVTASTPSEAAELFFATFNKARKCDVIEGVKDGHFFTVAFGRTSPKQWKDVTKNQAGELK